MGDELVLHQTGPESFQAMQVHAAIDPVRILTEAQRAAAALQDVIKRKPHKVEFGGQQYLEFEDWQTLGRFYGITARVRQTKYVEFEKTRGFEASAEAIASSGLIVSSAEAICTTEEPNWSRKPLFQLLSMAQTRACAKALRNVLAWVAVLAGYRPTPAEEMDPAPHAGDADTTTKQSRRVSNKDSGETRPANHISEAQRKRLYAIWKQAGWQDEDVKLLLEQRYGIEHTQDIPRPIYDDICKLLEAGPISEPDWVTEGT